MDTYISIDVHTCAHACTYAHAHAYLQAQACGHARTCTHTHGDTCTHTVCTHSVRALSRGEEDAVTEESSRACPLCGHHVTSLAGSRSGQWAVHTPVQALLGRAGCLTARTMPASFLPLQHRAPGLQKREKPVIAYVQLSPATSSFSPPPRPSPPAANSGSAGENGTRNKLRGASLLQPLGGPLLFSPCNTAGPPPLSR